MIVIHHAPGVDQFVREYADRLAAEGYVAAAPDLFHRITNEMVEQTGQSKRDQLSDPDIIADVNATVDFLRSHAAVDRERLGITGFCMGGRVVWLAAATNPHFKAAVPHYGGNIFVPWGAGEVAPFELSDGINCPMLFHFGEVDANPSQDDMRRLDDELTRLGKPHQFYTYPGADHAFMKPLYAPALSPHICGNGLGANPRVPGGAATARPRWLTQTLPNHYKKSRP